MSSRPPRVPPTEVRAPSRAVEIDVAPVPTQLRRARRALRTRLDLTTLGNEHITAVEAVANELLGAAFDGGSTEQLVLRVESFALLTSVRVHCPKALQIRDEPFGLRERVLDGYAFAWGRRRRTDGSVDLWAELAKPT